MTSGPVSAGKVASAAAGRLERLRTAEMQTLRVIDAKLATPNSRDRSSVSAFSTPSAIVCWPSA
jgi:hypothetical protein